MHCGVKIFTEVTDDDGLVTKSHVATREYGSRTGLGRDAAFAAALSECLIAMTLDSPRPSPIKVLNDEARNTIDNRLDIILALLADLPLVDSPAWLALKAIAEARSEFGAGFANRISVRVDRS